MRIFSLACSLILLGPAGASEFFYPVGSATQKPTSTFGNSNGYVVTNEFGLNRHTGVDLSNAQEGGSVRAIADGIIVERCITTEINKSDPSACNSFGNRLLVEHAHGIFSLYAHLQHGSVVKQVGDSVLAGQTIGKVDCTGRTESDRPLETGCASNGGVGSHLHFAVKRVNQIGCGYLTNNCASESSFAMYDSPLDFIEARRANMAMTTLIDFEQLPDGTPPTLFTEVGTQYAALGVKFRSRDIVGDQGPSFENSVFGSAFAIGDSSRSADPSSTFNTIAEFSSPAGCVSMDVLSFGTGVTGTARDSFGNTLAVVTKPDLSGILFGFSVFGVGQIASVEIAAIPDPAAATVQIDNLKFNGDQHSSCMF